MSILDPGAGHTAPRQANAATVSVPRTQKGALTGLKFAFFVWLSIRLLLSGWGALRFYVTPDVVYLNVHQHYPAAILPHRDLGGYVLGIWNIYDTPEYIKISQEGYASDPAFLTAFFPGYPLLIKLVGMLLSNNLLLAALVVTNVAAFFFFWYLYRLVALDYSPAVARRTVILSAVFPTAFFLFLGYTEAPLLAFGVAALYYARRECWWAAGLLALGAALVKQPGVFLFVPLVYLFWQQRRASPGGGWRAWGAALWLLLAPLAAIGFFVYRDFFLLLPGHDLTAMGASEELTIPGWPLLRALAVLRPDNPLIIVNAIDIIFALLLIGLVLGVLFRLRRPEYTLYTLIVAFASLALTWPDFWRPIVDMPRRLLVIFPIYLYMAITLESPRTFRWVIAGSVTAFLILSGLFITWTFVS